MKKKIKYFSILFLVCIAGISQLAAQPLSLDSCKVYAIENNKKLKEAHLKVNQSEEVEKNAFTKFFPTVSAQAFSMYSNENLIKGTIPEMNLPIYDGNPANLASATEFAYFPETDFETLDYAHTAVVTAIQPLYAGGRIRSSYKLAGVGKEISEESLQLSITDVIVKTEEYYWTLVSLRAKRKTLESYSEMLQSLLADVKVSYEAGLSQKSDLLKVELEINKLNSNLLKLDNSTSIVKMLLCQHIGISYSDNISVQDTDFVSELPESFYVSPDMALKNRTEYKLLSKSVDAEELQKKIACGEYMPQLSVGLGGQYLDIADQSNTFGMAFVSLSVPISDWWGGTHKIREHEFKVEAAKTMRDDQSELLRVEMENSYKNLTESYDQIEVAESSTTHAQEHLKVVSDNYKAGIMSTSKLLEAQAMYQESLDGLINARSTYQIQQVYYKKAIAHHFY